MGTENGQSLTVQQTLQLRLGICALFTKIRENPDQFSLSCGLNGAKFAYSFVHWGPIMLYFANYATSVGFAVDRVRFDQQKKFRSDLMRHGCQVLDGKK